MSSLSDHAAVAEMRTSNAPLPKKRTTKAKTKSQTQRQREAAEKAAGVFLFLAFRGPSISLIAQFLHFAEFAERLEAKAGRRATRKAKKESAKRLWE